MEKRFELGVTDILNKEFHIDLKGYNANEVDSFLDVVMADYASYEELVQHLGASLRKYEEEVKNLKNRIAELETSLQVQQVSQNAKVENVDILKRISRLEQAVFNQK